MDFEEQLLIGGLLMTIAVLSASHAHARPTAAARGIRVATIVSNGAQDTPLITSSRCENPDATPVHAAP